MRAPIRYPQFFAVPPFEPPAKELRHLLLERLGRGRRRAASAFVGCISGLGGQSMVALNFYHYGDQAAGTVARETPLWQAWIQQRFPMPTEVSKSE
jgi:hypothetical protein